MLELGKSHSPLHLWKDRDGMTMLRASWREGRSPARCPTGLRVGLPGTPKQSSPKYEESKTPNPKNKNVLETSCRKPDPTQKGHSGDCILGRKVEMFFFNS